MCGYLGVVSENLFDSEILSKPNNKIICRGPDETICLNSNDISDNNHTNFSFIFNRLAILDLSNKGSQPMVSEETKSILMFNGEIFNHKELRAELAESGINFKSTNSDSEVLLYGLEVYGAEFVNKIIGQFAIAFYNLRENCIYLIRDRLGQKPLFYQLKNNSLTFGSNLLSVAEVSNSHNMDESSMREFLSLGVVRSPRTIISEVFKLLPAEILKIDLNDFSQSSSIYWRPDQNINEDKFSKKEFLSIFSDSISKRLESDVPVANFLSGGIDSTSIIKNLNEQGKKINTFSAVYSDSKYDESEWIGKVKKRYSTNHSEAQLDIDLDIEKIFEVIDIFDEPYCDPSVVPSFFLNKLISKSYKVALSGDGGDELLGGYKRVSEVLASSNMIKSLYSKIYNLYPSFLGTGNHFKLRSHDIKERYESYFVDEKFLSLLKVNEKIIFKENNFKNSISDYKSLLLTDYSYFLPEMMMLKIDRTSMANSLEVRSPFVDHRLIEYVMKHDTSYFDRKNTKKVLKEYLMEDFNDTFINRKKMGFVFNLEKFIYNNKSEICKYITENNSLINNLDKKLKKLNRVKSRMNAIRIFKLLILTRYHNNLLKL
jgi:asparagine synthase (glutamine-hydrolysing)